MTRLESIVIGILLGFMLFFVHPAKAAPTFKENQTRCAQNARAIGELKALNPPLPIALNQVSPDARPIVIFVWENHLTPIKAFYYTFGYCMNDSKSKDIAI